MLLSPIASNTRLRGHINSLWKKEFDFIKLPNPSPGIQDTMWLIDTKTLRLVEKNDVSEVKYAILSHTWEEGEVTFQEFQVREYFLGRSHPLRLIETRTCNGLAVRGGSARSERPVNLLGRTTISPTPG